MELALSMIIHNERDNLEPCLERIHHLFAEIVVVDGGSNDGGPEWLQRHCGSRVIVVPTSDEVLPDLAALRNRGLETVHAPWVLILDADERVCPRSLEKLRHWQPPPGVDGLFLPWITLDAGGSRVDDYKLAVFRREARSSGVIHENMQVDFRRRRWHACWSRRLPVLHYPQAGRKPAKQLSYLARLESALQENPRWTRYAWFLGYQYLHAGRPDLALPYLEQAAGACSPLFPVEGLNAAMVLITLLEGLGRRRKALAVLDRARHFYHLTRDDFEVRINRRIQPWLNRAERILQGLEPGPVRAYAFTF